ncbi:unnamed protein product [Rotaria socialis]|uniref:DNA-directed RNA polymerase III subunit n=1 Tax=Rotaria socialis TaxID=392032 RepID=A0A818C144_9BILA|nr:unnamed protein product [Rotaria socialis]CAF3425810.1 unnamed protein product [Rotaria socialis]CAF3434412.1 unnamed protein product [Rotaria socialis]CAF3628960.1 unnamed protein product [Rotaria socialis]CAF3635769.1 unnamed protein product [Rotaria socialis]
MAFGRGHASFTIDALKLAKDSLPADVNEPPPVFPELVNTPHPLIENPTNDYDYKLKLKLNFNSSFRTLHDPTKIDHEKNFILNKWKEEWSILPRELKQASRININSSKIKPNLSKKNIRTQNKKTKTLLNIDLSTYEEKQSGDQDEDDEPDDEKNDDNIEINENDEDNEGKPKDIEKKKLTDNENEIDGEMANEEEEDMDEDEAADYFDSYNDSGDRDGDDLDDDGGDGGD